MANPTQLRGTPSATGPTPAANTSAGLTPQMALVNADRTPTVFFFRWLLNSRAAAAAGGSQTPWTSDIDAAGFALNNLGGIELDAGAITFPDGSTQTTAAAALTPATAIKLGGVKIGANITVAADGTISVAAPGGGGGAVTSVTASAPLASSGGATPNITITSPLPVANGGSGSAAPSLVAGANITITGAWPNQTIAAAAGTSAVSSVFGRAGAVVAVAGDYTVAQVTGAVASSRQIIAGAGLTGGGDLTADRTLAVNTAAIAPAIQTPWLQNIDGAAHSLSNVSSLAVNLTISAGGNISTSGALLVTGTLTISGGAAPAITSAGIIHLVPGGGTLFADVTGVGVGIDVTIPAAKLEIGITAGKSGFKTGGLEMQSFAANNSYFSENCYHNGSGFIYRAAGFANVLRIFQGDLDWFNAPSGAAGAAATITSALTIKNSGNVGINTALPQFPLEVTGNAKVSGTLNIGGAANTGQQLRIFDQSTNGHTFSFYSASDILTIVNYGGGTLFTIVATGLVTINYALAIPFLVSSNPGAGTKQLWYDPADGNRVKFAA